MKHECVDAISEILDIADKLRMNFLIQVICHACRDTMTLDGSNEQGSTFTCLKCSVMVTVRLKKEGMTNDLLGLLYSIAALKDCDEEPERCESQSGPYCGTHGENYLHSEDIQRARKLLTEFKDGIAYMPVPQCETCAWWEPRPDDHYVPPIASGACTEKDGPWSDCGDYTILTANNFGCILWKAKS